MSLTARSKMCARWEDHLPAKAWRETGRGAVLPIFVSFNAESPVKRRDNELADEWLYRTIAYTLLGANSSLRQDVAAKFGTVTCGESTLQAYFKSQKNVVLLVDELQLLLKSPNNANRDAERQAARFMKDVFLGAERVPTWSSPPTFSPRGLI